MNRYVVGSLLLAVAGTVGSASAGVTFSNVTIGGSLSAGATFYTSGSDIDFIFPAATVGDTVDPVRSGNIVITYGGGQLQSATSLNGTWQNETAPSPVTVQPSGAGKFYRVRG